jgi:hypothetical protein
MKLLHKLALPLVVIAALAMATPAQARWWRHRVFYGGYYGYGYPYYYGPGYFGAYYGAPYYGYYGPYYGGGFAFGGHHYWHGGYHHHR